MILGGIFYPFFSSLAFLTPYLIFLMLLAPYCRLSPADLRIRPWQLILLTIQIAGGLALYAVLRPFGEVVAQGAFICVLAPTATSAAGVAGMLLADVAQAVMLWTDGIDQTLRLGGAGMLDTIVISGVSAVLFAELLGEFIERCVRGAKRKEGARG